MDAGQDRLSDLKIIDQLLRTYDRRATPTNKIGETINFRVAINDDRAFSSKLR